MKTGSAILTAGGAIALGLIALFSARVLDHYPSLRVEAARTKMIVLEETTRERLAGLEHDLQITWFVSPRERMPSHMRQIERNVLDLLRTMKRRAGGRLDFQVVDPESRPDLLRFAARHQVAPFRVRSVARDSYSEKTVWSSLLLSYGPSAPAAINGISPEHLPRLQSLLIQQLDQMENPRPPRIGFSAPAGFENFQNDLARHGEVVPLDLNGGGEIPDGIDLLFWMEPRATEFMAGRLERFLEEGKSAVIAGSPHALLAKADDDQEAFELAPSGFHPDQLLSRFGFRLIPGLVLDELSLDLNSRSGPVQVPAVIRCIAPNQDFRPMRGLPNGPLLFVAPGRFGFDQETLDQAGWSVSVLATTSDQTRVRPSVYGPVSLLQETNAPAIAAPKLPLMVWVRPRDPWRGSLVFSGSASPFQNGVYELDGFAHEKLAGVLRRTLGSPERLVIQRAGIQAPELLPSMDAGGRLFWRAAVLCALPLVLAGVAWKRGLLRGQDPADFDVARASWPASSPGLSPASPGNGETPSELAAGTGALRTRALGWRGGLVAVGIVVGLFATISAAPGRLDLTRDKLNALSPATRELAASASDLNLTLYISQPRQLPPELRPGARQLRGLLRELQGGGHSYSQVHPDLLPARDELESAGVQSFQVSTRQDETTTVRTVFCTLRLESRGEVKLLHFRDPASFEHIEFRLALALWELKTGRAARIGFAGDSPRLSPAEAFHDFQQRRLLAPSGTDVYSLARSFLEQHGFEISHVDPRRPDGHPEFDLLVWMQPRRNILPMLDLAVSHLNAGRPLFIAAQHFNMQSRQYPGAGFKVVYWPQPQMADLELHYFPQLGIELVREVLFDELSAPLPLDTQINRSAGREYDRQTSALPFNIRAAAGNFSSHTMTRGVGDQLFPSPAFIRLDEERLGRFGIKARPLITTSARSWSFDWQGGWLPEEQLAGPSHAPAGAGRWLGRLPLAVLFEGPFPRPSEPLSNRSLAESEPVELAPEPGLPAQLLLAGGSDLFKNERLFNPEFRGDHLLLNAVAGLVLPEEIAQLAGKRPVPQGLDYIEPGSRLGWRAFVCGSGPAILLLFGLTWKISRRSRSHPAL